MQKLLILSARQVMSPKRGWFCHQHVAAKAKISIIFQRWHFNFLSWFYFSRMPVGSKHTNFDSKSQTNSMQMTHNRKDDMHLVLCWDHSSWSISSVSQMTGKGSKTFTAVGCKQLRAKTSDQIHSQFLTCAEGHMLWQSGWKSVACDGWCADC